MSTDTISHTPMSSKTESPSDEKYSTSDTTSVQDRTMPVPSSTCDTSAVKHKTVEEKEGPTLRKRIVSYTADSFMIIDLEYMTHLFMYKLL